MNQSHLIFRDNDQNQLEYNIYGSGSAVLFCFPGFGESLTTFSILSEHLIDYRIIAVNLYFIGASKKAQTNQALTPEDWQKTFGEFLAHLSTNRFSVLGFSLGGRFAAVTFKYFHKRMDHLILVAADAIQLRFAYQLATFPIFSRQLFWSFMKFPNPFFAIIKLLTTIRLINPFTAKFALKHLHSPELRDTLYRSWTTFKPLRIKQKELIELLNTTNCQSTVILGKKDQIIHPKKHQSFIKNLKQSAVFILPYGHNKLVNNSINEITEALTQ